MINQYDKKRCLLIGSAVEAFGVTVAPMNACSNIFEGITAAQNSNYEIIYVVFSQLPNPAPQALEALHQVSPDSKLCLLVKMHEEPLATEIYRTNRWAVSVLDYKICPIDPLALDEARSRQISNGNASNIIEKDRRIAELAALVTQDDLTGLKNRRYVRQFLPAILQKAAEAGCQVTLLLFDIDDFKHYNDTYGHNVGDDVLRQTASLMRRCCRDQDVVARMGGDEFAVIFWDIPEHSTHPGKRATDRRRASQDHPRQALFMTERFRGEMSDAPFDLLGAKGKGSLTISGGLATFPTDAQSAEELYERADQAMLEAKRSGKDRIQLVGSND